MGGLSTLQRRAGGPHPQLAQPPLGGQVRGLRVAAVSARFGLLRVRSSQYAPRRAHRTVTPLHSFNLFEHTFAELRRPRPTADPSIATAWLQVILVTCGLAGLLAATRRLSDRPGFDRLDRAGHGCCLTVDAPRILFKATEVIAGFRYTRVYCCQPSR